MISMMQPARGHHARHALLGACLVIGAATPLAADVVQGTPFQMGDGAAWVYLVTEGGKPTELGVALDQGFLDALPAEGADGAVLMPDGRSTFEFVLAMPEANQTPFQLVTLDWNPSGHEPDGVYDLAHLDVHFYTISDAERMTISPEDADFLAKGAREPAREYMPFGYVNPGAPPVPFMGTHLVDLSAPEWHGEHPERFSHTFLYGIWDGRLTFLEPMVTSEFLASKPDVIVPISVAARYEPAGYYPDHYSIRWDEASNEYRIALNGLQPR